MKRIVSGGVLVLLACAALTAQTPQPAFEVASVKPAQPPAPGTRFSPLTGGPGSKTPTRLAGNATLKMLLMRAYDVKIYQISGPAWMDTEMYEISARIAEGATKEQFAAMLQNLLTERFKMVVRRETRELPFYVLAPAKGGPKFKESDPSAIAEDEKRAAEGNLVRPRITAGADGFPEIPADAKLPGSFTLSLSNGQFRRIKMFARHMTMDELAEAIGGHLNRPVRNLTELKGKYDFVLAWESDPQLLANDAAMSEAERNVAANPAPTLFGAVQQQLGLRLEQRKGPVQMLMVEKAERVPTEN
jgi:uncharacterized protein (TIGR03435 family)